MAVKLNQHDLQFILKQIKIAEAHASGTPLIEVRVDENGNYDPNGKLAISQPHLPYGLRTVDGTYNNIIPGRELWGAADQTMPRMFDPHWRNEDDGDEFDTNGPQPNGVVDNNNYNSGGGSAGSVADVDPRLISNLIVDQSPNNPAALIAALRHAGHEGDLTAKMALITTPFALVHAAEVADSRVASWLKMKTDVQAAITAAGANVPPGLPGVLAMATAHHATAVEQAAIANDAAEDYEHVLIPDGSDEGELPDSVITGARAVVDYYAAQFGIEFEADGTSLVIPNVAPDEGLSAPFNGWMTFFGQFFDHGLDLISKGGDGTIYIPLQPDDPLYVPGGFTNFMVLTRATQVEGPGADGVLGTADDTREAINVTTPFVDQNQTYTSHPSHQVFLREYQMDANGRPLATGRLLDGSNGGLPTWADVKAQAKAMLGIELTDRDVFNIPLMRTDLYGEFIRGPGGFPQVIIDIGVDGIPNTADDIVMSGTPANPLKLNPATGGTEPVRTSHSFLDDIAHNAVPVLSTQGILMTDGTNVPGTDPAGNAVQFDPLNGRNTEYDNELLDKHFVTGDGRGNENIGLTAVHHVFHSEHNRQVTVNMLTILQSGDLAFINEWLATDITQVELNTVLAGMTGNLEQYLHGATQNGVTLNWDGERLFQTARFATEMQYQHLVFEEFGRKIQPMIDVFVFNTLTDIDPAIFAEFAHVVYRFGHSMLTEDISRMFLNAQGEPIHYDEDGNPVVVTGGLGDWGQDIGLIEAFLNPVEFDKDGSITHEQAAGAIFRGMSLVQGNEIDEFIVDALRTNLLGLPLDLAAVNIARGRDTGMPTLNQARTQLYEASNSTFVKPYVNWADFAANLKNPASVINFIAAYGTHAAITAAGDDISDRRAAATLLVMGDGGAANDVTINGTLYTNRLDFLNATGAFAGGSLGGLNDIDLWIGGLAEKKMPFGGMLGSTFNAVFEAQLEMLQDFDRFYYLTRTQGLNLLNELENNAFSKLIAANTDMINPGPDGIRGTADDIESGFRTGVDSFAKHDFVLNVDPDKQIEDDPEHDDAALNAVGMTKVQRDDVLTATDESLTKNYIRFLGGEHTVIGGSEGDDTIIADYGDDAIWGGGGHDRIEGGAGVDLLIGGAGNDIITDSGDTGDFIKGEDGDDIIANSNGLDILMGGDGKDVFFVGVDGTEVFAGEGDDFILGGADIDFLMGNEGSDWIEGGDGFDTLAGENSELFFNSTILGHDVMFAGENENDFDAESGDDIMVQGESVMRNEGMLGFDWAIHKGNRVAADSDMRIPIFTNVADNILRDRFDNTEALSGWIHNDVLKGDDRGSQEEIEVELDMRGHELNQSGVDRIDGLRQMLGLSARTATTTDDAVEDFLTAWTGGNVLIGGDGNDTIEGRGGDDFIHGDAWLNVRIRITGIVDPNAATPVGKANRPENEIATVDTLKHVFTDDDVTTSGAAIPASWVGKSLFDLMMARTIVPSQMHIVREIKYDEDTSNNVDTAIFAGNRDWYEITQLDNGTVRVARREMEEVDPNIDEGTDTLVGIERIQFADQTVVLSQSGNFEPTGRLVISGLPARENEPLTVSPAQVYDANNPGAGPGNVGNITYRWQIERNDGTGDYIDIPGSFGTSFTPDDEHTGLRIRVLGTYVDAGGVTETVMSLPTDVVSGVNDAPVGDLLISDTSPTEGQQLTATVAFTDADGITDAFEEGLLTYQWQYQNNGTGPWINDGPAQATSNYTPGAGRVGDTLRVEVVYTDDLGNVHTVHSAPTTIVGDFNDANTTTGDPDVYTGNAGDDWLIGDASNETINGAAGNDILDGGEGNDTLNGGVGDDTLDGGEGTDVFNGDDGDDVLRYDVGDGTDTFNGGAGSDTISVTGDDGNDLLDVTFNGARITHLETSAAAGNINDVEVFNADLFDGASEAGGDTLNYQSATTVGVEVNLLTGAATGFSYIRNIENVEGANFADTLIGNNEANRLFGDGGADTLRGGFGNDDLEGGTGNDLLYGEGGDDLLEGGAGNDRVDGGAGNDTATYASAAASVSVTLLGTATTLAGAIASGAEDLLVDIENLTGSAFNDSLTGNSGANILDGGAGADTMTGGAGDDTYVVDDVVAAGGIDQVIELTNGGIDTVIVTAAVGAYTLGTELENLTALGNYDGTANLTGNGGANVITGGDGTDNIYGLAGNDTLIGGEGGSDRLDGGADTDTVILQGSLSAQTFALSDGNVTVAAAGYGTDTLVSIEKVRLNGIDYNLVAGTAGNDTALANPAGADLVLGFGGNDTLNGGSSNDILIGGTGTNTLNAGAGNDIIVGGTGTDTMNGDDGIDTADYSQSNAAVVVNRNSDTASGGHAAGDSLNSIENVVGSAHNDTLTGNGDANELAGGAGNDQLVGMGGNDRLIGGAGDDILTGGDQAGTVDTAVFAGNASNYVFGTSGTGITVSSSSEGTDTLTGIERLEFADRTLQIVTGSGNADTIVGTAAGSIIFGGAGNDTITGGDGNDIIVGGAGNDNLFGSDVGEGDNAVTGATDDDTFIWNATGADGFGEGVDTINGGFEGAAGDTVVVNGNGSNETFGIYTYDEAVARLGYTGDDEVEIIVTRHVGNGTPVIIAELTDIEEIVVDGRGGTNATQMFGDFSLTSLRPSTITIIGGAGDDTVNISSLLSAHRIVFKTGGGNDTIIGSLRPQDVIEFPAGMSIADFEVTIEDDGLTTLVGGSHKITFVAPDGMPQFGEAPDEEEDPTDDNDDDDDSGDDDDDDDDSDDDQDDDDDGEAPSPPVSGSVKTGTLQADVLVGTAGDDSIVAFAGDDVATGDAGNDNIAAGEGADFVSGGEGRDVIFAGIGDDQVFGGGGADIINGDSGADRIFGDAGNDLITAGSGDDTVFGGAGNDLIVAEVNDGNDVYFGDASEGGSGNDTLDMSAMSSAVTVNLGVGPLGNGSATGSQIGTDTLWGIENVNTGSGNDTLIASNAVNILNGGSGNDTFRFNTASAADGDSIYGFEPGDRLDLGNIDANVGEAGDQAFTVLSGGSFTAAGQLAVKLESRDDGDFTVIQGNINDDLSADFRIEIEGHHSVSSTNTTL